MTEGDQRLRTVLDEYANFLREKKLAVPKHQPCLVRWVREFLLFAQQHGGYTFEQTLDLFLADVGRRVGVKPWQIQQAADAVRIYRYQFRGAQQSSRVARHWAIGPNRKAGRLVDRPWLTPRVTIAW